MNWKRTIPELFFILSTIYYWTLTGELYNWVAITLLIVLAALIAWNHPYLGISLSMAIIALNLFLFIALFSEFKEFKLVNTDAKTLIMVGSFYLSFNIYMAGKMLYKYLPLEEKTR